MSDNGPVRLRAVAEQLVSEAADFVRRRRVEIMHAGVDGVVGVRAKSSTTDPVTPVDTATEQLVRDRLARLRPGESILG